MNALAKSGKLKNARFLTSSMQKEMDTKHGRNYAREFKTIADRNGWNMIVANNHSKIILMRTETAHYVLETSSNLNENPKIEQYSFENSKEVYDFYNHFFDCIFGGAQP